MGSPVSSQKPYSPDSMRASDWQSSSRSFLSRSRVRSSRAVLFLDRRPVGRVGNDRRVLAQVLGGLAGVAEQVVLERLQLHAGRTRAASRFMYSDSGIASSSSSLIRGPPWFSRRSPVSDRPCARVGACRSLVCSSVGSGAAAARTGRRIVRSAAAAEPAPAATKSWGSAAGLARHEAVRRSKSRSRASVGTGTATLASAAADEPPWAQRSWPTRASVHRAAAAGAAFWATGRAVGFFAADGALSQRRA